MNTDLVIIGGGAAGLMAGITAGELGLRALIIERKHRPGRKLLMCGNNRCNLTCRRSVPDLLAAYGEPVASFLAPALTAFPPDALRQWFVSRGLKTTVHADGRVFPASERADDVLHCLSDSLRDLAIPLLTNCPVTGVVRVAGGFRVTAPAVELMAPRVLIATGGVSYPKTGSVGDGQKWAKALGHRIVPYRPGLAGVEFVDTWLAQDPDVSMPDVALRIVSEGEIRATTSGELLLSRRCARGPCMVNATRAVARLGLRRFEFEIDLCPHVSPGDLRAQLVSWVSEHGSATLRELVCVGHLPPRIAADWVEHYVGLPAGREVGPGDCGLVDKVGEALKCWRPAVGRIRPLKEAMVTVGGVALGEVNPNTLESCLCTGLLFAGEVLDVDGPTGGYNLQAAFATGRLAVMSVARSLGLRVASSGGGRESPVADGRGGSRRAVRRGGHRRVGRRGTGRGHR